MAKLTNLAELVSKIEEPSPSSNVSQSSFDTDEGTDKMATSTVACNSCVHHITKSSEFWCFKCKEDLCTDCRECHSIDKATQDHVTITIGEYQKSPPVIVGINLFCDEHRKKCQKYCKNHKRLCCPKCVIASHNKCKDLVLLKEVVKNVKNSNSVQEMEHLIDGLTKNIKTIIASRKDNQDMLNVNKTGITNEIKETRMALNGYLDKLETVLLTKLQEASERENGKIMKLVATLEEKEKEILECQDNLQNIKTHATDLQAFLGLEQIKHEITKNERFVQSLIDHHKVSKTTLHCQIHQSLQNLTTDVHCFGEVTTSITPCDNTLVRSKDKQAQMMVAGGSSRKPKSLMRADMSPRSAIIGQCNKCESGKCMTCNTIQCTSTFRSTYTEESFIIHCTANCKTENVIYLMECAKCGLQYIGETKRRFMIRLKEHRSNAMCNCDLPISNHLKSRSFNIMKATIIEHDPKWDDEGRRKRESFWIRKLQTISPNGMNKNK